MAQRFRRSGITLLPPVPAAITITIKLLLLQLDASCETALRHPSCPRIEILFRYRNYSIKRIRMEFLVLQSSKMVQRPLGLSVPHLPPASIVHSTPLTPPTMKDSLIGDVGHRKIPDPLSGATSLPRRILHKKGQVRRGARCVGKSCLSACCALELDRTVNKGPSSCTSRSGGHENALVTAHWGSKQICASPQILSAGQARASGEQYFS